MVESTVAQLLLQLGVAGVTVWICWKFLIQQRQDYQDDRRRFDAREAELHARLTQVTDSFLDALRGLVAKTDAALREHTAALREQGAQLSRLDARVEHLRTEVLDALQRQRDGQREGS